MATWWERSVAKERRRMTNAPRVAKGDRWGCPEDYSHLAPPLKPMKKTYAR